MAYMDGQMSASEALEFERSLSPEDQKRLTDEVRLESAICDSLGGQECCPIALWNSLALRMKNETVRRRWFSGWSNRFVAAAAAVAIMVTSSMVYHQFRPETTTVEATGLGITESNITDFASHSEVPGTREATQRYLDDNNIGLKIVSFEEAKLNPHHPMKLLGACKGKCDKGVLIEVRMTCCDKPIKLVVAKEGSEGASLIRKATRCGTVQKYRVTNGYVTALVGDIHGHVDLLNLLQAKIRHIV